MMNKRFWNNKRVMVTGHEGFLGAWLTKTLVERGAHVVGIDKTTKRPKTVLKSCRDKITCIKGDIAQASLINRVVKKYKPQNIFHLAAEATVDDCCLNPVRAFKTNIEGTWNILQAAKENKFIKSIVVASSDKAYGIHKELPYKENFPLQGNHPYDVSKSCTDLLCQTYHHTYGVGVCITRCGNIYGPGDYHQSRIVPDAIQSILKGKNLVIRSDGTFTRDYIYVEDIVGAYLLLAEKMSSLNLFGEAFNFSIEKPISVLDLFNTIRDLIDQESLPPQILNKAKFEIKHQFLSAKKAKKILGWKPQYTLKKGLVKTIEWYKHNG